MWEVAQTWNVYDSIFLLYNELCHLSGFLFLISGEAILIFQKI